jgi:hypothetical protein
MKKDSIYQEIREGVNLKVNRKRQIEIVRSHDLPCTPPPRADLK